MYSMYIDETGTGSNYTILAGVIINAKVYQEVCKAIEKLLMDVFGTRNIILKEIRRMSYQESKFTHQQYLSFEENYYNLLSSHKPVFIVSAVRNDTYSRKDDIISKAYEHLLEGFHLFLKKNKDSGQIIYDKSEGYFRLVKEKHRKLLEDGSCWGWKFSSINEIFDKDDQGCRVLQIADLLGAAIHAYLNSIRENKTHYNKCLPFFDRGPEGQISGYGLKIFPTQDVSFS